MGINKLFEKIFGKESHKISWHVLSFINIVKKFYIKQNFITHALIEQLILQSLNYWHQQNLMI